MGDEPLLKITLDEYGSVPVVEYQGEEIKGKVRVTFDWQTDGEFPKFPFIHIERAVTGIKEKCRPYLETIEKRSPYIEGESDSLKALGNYSVEELKKELERRPGIEEIVYLCSGDCHAE